jgi:hypothetical protein
MSVLLGQLKTIKASACAPTYRVKADASPFFFTSVYSALAMVASGVLPLARKIPSRSAVRVMSPVDKSRRSERRTSIAAVLKMPPAPGMGVAAGPSVDRSGCGGGVEAFVVVVVVVVKR